MSIEVRFCTTQVYETEDENEALKWAEEDLMVGRINTSDLSMQLVVDDNE
jgi:hypothetical protein